VKGKGKRDNERSKVKKTEEENYIRDEWERTMKM
jgi:hypothetical protein